MTKSLVRRLNRAKKYLNYIIFIEKYEKVARDEEEIYNWLMNNRIYLQKQMDKYNYGRIEFQPKYSIIFYPRYNVISEFPLLFFSERYSFQESASKLIPLVKSELENYIQELVDILQTQKERKAEEALDFASILKDINKNFRKNVIQNPQNEPDVQDYLEGFLAVKEYDFKREKNTVGFSGKSFRPDFTSKKFNMAIEVKYVDTLEKTRKCVDEMSADITPYSKKWKNILFLVYDIGGNIRDVNEYTNDFNKNGDITIRCIVIKH